MPHWLAALASAIGYGVLGLTTLCALVIVTALVVDSLMADD